MERFRAWLVGGGARIDAVEITERDGLRGAIAARDIAAGEVVVSIPRVLLVTLEQLALSELGRGLLEADLALSSMHATFAAWLCTARRRADSPYHPWFDTLPRDLDDHSIHASADELALVAGTMTGALLDELRADLDEDLAALRAHVAPCRDLARDDLLWAGLFVGSRVYGLIVDDVDTSVLVPFGDLFNHAAAPGTNWYYDVDSRAFVIVARRAHRAGEPLCIRYGGKPNSRLLVQYGFTLPDNLDDEAALLGHHVPRDPRHAEAQAMLAALRARHPDVDDARAALTAAVDDAIARFPSTLAADDALLAGPLSPRARGFVIARRGELAVLHAWRDLAPSLWSTP